MNTFEFIYSIKPDKTNQITIKCEGKTSFDAFYLFYK